MRGTPLRQLATPALLVDVERMERNVARMAAAIGAAGVALRPHVKTSKLLQVIGRQRDAGAVGFTCATPGEVDALLRAGFDDVLWAHQPVGAAKVAFALDAHRRATAAGGRLRVALDSRAAAEPLSRAAVEAGVELPFLLEVDTGLGRAGVAPEAVAQAAHALALPGLRLEGAMTHEGHAGAHVGDRAAIERTARAAAEAMVGAGEVLRALGVADPVVSVGSTPGAASAPFVPGVTEARPGTYVFYDANQVAMESATWDDCAVTVLARVVSRPRADVAIVDAGLKAMSGDGAAGGRRGWGRPLGLDADFTVAFEEHGVLAGPGAGALRVGDLVRVVPNHVCGAVNMWSQAHAVRDGEVMERWSIVGRR